MAEFQSEGGLISIVITNHDSLLAASVANTYAKELQDYKTLLSVELSESLDFLNARIDSAENYLKKTEKSLLEFKRSYRGRLDQLDLIDQLRTEYSWRQMLLDSRVKVYNSLLSQREELRYEHHREMPRFEILNLAKAEDVVEVGWSLPGRAAIGAGIGFVLSIFSAFVVEYFARSKASGRLQQLSKAYRGVR